MIMVFFLIFKESKSYRLEEVAESLIFTPIDIYALYQARKVAIFASTVPPQSHAGLTDCTG